MERKTESQEIGRRLLVVAAGAVFVDSIFFTVLAPLLPHYRQASDLSDAGIGLLSASYALGSLAFALPAGVLAVRWGARRTVTAGLIAIGGSSLIFGLTDAAAILVTGRVLQGAAGALVLSGALTWVIEASSGDRKGELIGTVSGVGIFGSLAGPGIGAGAVALGPNLVFSVIAAACMLLSVAAARTSPAPPRGRHADGRDIARALRLKPVRLSLLLVTAPGICFGVLAVVGPLRMDALGGGALLIALGYTGSAAIEGLLAPVVGRWSDRSGRMRPYLPGLGVCALGMVAVGVAPSALLLLGAVLFSATGAGLCATPGFAQLSDSAAGTATHQGIAVALANVGWSAGQGIGGLGAGLLAHAGGYALPLVLGGLMLMGAGLLASRVSVPAPDGARSMTTAGAAARPAGRNGGRR